MAKSAKAAAKPLADFIAKQLDIQASLGKSQKDIATEIGYERPNMISMFKTGDVKVPIDKVPALARALNVDPAFMMRLAMQQYWKDEAEAIAAVFGTVLSKNETKIIEAIRSVTKDTDPALTPALERKLKAVFKE